jgi:hypothetical protein
MAKTATLCFVVLVVIAWASSNLACSCAQDNSDKCTALKRSRLLLKASIVNKTAVIDKRFPRLSNGAIDPQAVRNKFGAKVEAVLNNNYTTNGFFLEPGSVIFFDADLAGNLCGLDILVNTRYLLELYYSEGGLSTNICSKTTPWSDTFSACFTDWSNSVLSPVNDIVSVDEDEIPPYNPDRLSDEKAKAVRSFLESAFRFATKTWF